MFRPLSVPGSVPASVFAALLAVSLVASGCAVGPDYKSPETRVPDRWSAPAASVPADDPAPLARWWTGFRDPELTSLIERAFQANLDLKLAQTRIRQARASLTAAGGGLGPTASATGAFQRGQSPQSSGKTAGPVTNQYQTGFDAGWEIDLFGGLRRGREAAAANLQAAVETRRNVFVTLASEVARNYIALRTGQRRIALARATLEAQRRSAELTRTKARGGFSSGLDAAGADSAAAATAAQIPALETAVRQTIHNLGVLLGREPAALLQELSPEAAVPAAPPAIPAGIPSDLLRRRPDIRAAEAGIHAATARIGVATADLFPKLTLSGAVGTQAANTGSLFQQASRFWSFGPSADWQIFSMGRTQANIELQKAAREETFVAYQQTVLAALQEVEDALTAAAGEESRRAALVQAEASSRKAVELSTALYTEGQTDFLNVLEAQRSLYSAQDALAQSAGALATDVVALYKALGGGWEEDAKPAAGAAKR